MNFWRDARNRTLREKKTQKTPGDNNVAAELLKSDKPSHKIFVDWFSQRFEKTRRARDVERLKGWWLRVARSPGSPFAVEAMSVPVSGALLRGQTRLQLSWANTLRRALHETTIRLISSYYWQIWSHTWKRTTKYKITRKNCGPAKEEGMWSNKKLQQNQIQVMYGNLRDLIWQDKQFRWHKIEKLCIAWNTLYFITDWKAAGKILNAIQ